MIDNRKNSTSSFLVNLKKYPYVRLGNRNSEAKEISTQKIEGVVCVLLTAYSKV